MNFGNPLKQKWSKLNNVLENYHFKQLKCNFGPKIVLLHSSLPNIL
jgi:hypothetical protein